MVLLRRTELALVQSPLLFKFASASGEFDSIHAAPSLNRGLECMSRDSHSLGNFSRPVPWNAMESSSNTSSTANSHVSSSGYPPPPFNGGGGTEKQGTVVGIGRRPLNYTGSDGWGPRIGYRTLWGGAIGTGTGLLMGTSKGSNVPKSMGIMGTNCALVTLCFCGFQELVREIRAADPDDLVNCVLGGLASGGLLGRIQGGPSRVLPCALLFAGVGTGLQFGANQLKEYRLRQFLNKKDTELVPKPEVKVIEPKVKQEDFRFPEWFPIQVLDEKAAAKRKAEQEEEFRGRVDRLQKGERP